MQNGGVRSCHGPRFPHPGPTRTNLPVTLPSASPMPHSPASESDRAELLAEIDRLRGIVSRHGLDDAGRPGTDSGFLSGGGEMAALMRSMD